MTTSLSNLYNESVVLTSVDGKEVRYFDHELFASLIIDLAVECVRDELRDPKSTLTYDQCSRLQNRIREQFQKE